MHDILNDIEKLKEIQEAVDNFSRQTVKSMIDDIIKEKLDIVEKYEQTENPEVNDILNKTTIVEDIFGKNVANKYNV